MVVVSDGYSDHGTHPSGKVRQMASTANAILRNASETLRIARSGFADFAGPDPARRDAGFRNAVVFGRAVTNVLEHLRGKVPNFDEWYKPKSLALKEDEGFRTLYQLRSQILKEGTGGPSMSIHIGHMDTADLAPLMRNPPPGAKGFFVGDMTGGSGWEVELPDGEKEKYYVSLPASIDMSVTHQIGDEDAKHLLSRYLNEMQSLIAEARAQFGTEDAA